MKTGLLTLACVFFFFSASFANEMYQFTGVHYFASYKECDHEALCSLDRLKAKMLDASKESGAKILGFSDYVFPPEGYTLVILLSESHASIHTYPECDSCYVDLFTCGSRCDASKFAKFLKSYLKPKVAQESILSR